MSRALSSGGNTIGNTVDPIISIPETLLPAGFAACREPLPRPLSFRHPALPRQDYTLLENTSDTYLPPPAPGSTRIPTGRRPGTLLGSHTLPWTHSYWLLLVTASFSSPRCSLGSLDLG